jgi:hypothetical protein
LPFVFVPDAIIHPFGYVDSEQVYAKFILDYAASGDAIRALWMEIKEEQTLVVRFARMPSRILH